MTPGGEIAITDARHDPGQVRAFTAGMVVTGPTKSPSGGSPVAGAVAGAKPPRVKLSTAEIQAGAA